MVLSIDASFYSVLKLPIGLANAALMARKLIVTNVITKIKTCR